MIRVPLLLQKSIAVIHRLDVTATRALDPPGESTVGYDEILNEPIKYDSGPGTPILASRQELSPVRVECQVEAPTFEQLQQHGPGIVENTVLVLVLHRKNLKDLSLLDPTTGKPLIKKSDRVSAIEKFGFPGTVLQPLAAPGLFVYEVRPGSWGFGDGHDLELVFLEDRARTP